MFEPKPLTKKAVPAAIERAERYRLLNEPVEAESICRDVLRVDPDNREALRMLLLALTEQFDQRLNENFQPAKDLLERFDDEYSRLYYRGIICERRAKCSLNRGGPGSGFLAYDWLRRAMECYEQAAEVRPAGNDDAILRWNTCGRIIDKFPEVQPAPEESTEPMLE